MQNARARSCIVQALPMSTSKSPATMRRRAWHQSCSVNRYAAQRGYWSTRTDPFGRYDNPAEGLGPLAIFARLPNSSRARGPPCRQPRRESHRIELDPGRRSGHWDRSDPHGRTETGRARPPRGLRGRRSRCAPGGVLRARHRFRAIRPSARRRDRGIAAGRPDRRRRPSRAGTPPALQRARGAHPSHGALPRRHRQPRGALFASHGGASPCIAGRHWEATGSARWQRIEFVIPDVSKAQALSTAARSASSRPAALAARQIRRPSNCMQTSHSTEPT